MTVKSFPTLDRGKEESGDTRVDILLLDLFLCVGGGPLLSQIYKILQVKLIHTEKVGLTSFERIILEDNDRCPSVEW